MKNSMKTLMVTAAVSGLLGGTAARLQATPVPASKSGISVKASATNLTAGKISVAKAAIADADQPACKGKNYCKGHGRCKAGANGCKAKNDCKGKGGCDTDES